MRQQGKDPSQYGFHNGARSQRVAKNLSFWCEKCRTACNGSLTSLEIKQHLIPISLPSLFSPLIFDFSPSVLSLDWKVYSFTLYELSVFLPSLPHWMRGFSLIDPLSRFLPQFSTGLGGFSPATWPFEIHQIPYKAKMFLVVSRFSSPISLIGLGGFSLDFHSSLQQFPHLAELTSKERGNCNNMTFGAQSF